MLLHMEIWVELNDRHKADYHKDMRGCRQHLVSSSDTCPERNFKSVSKITSLNTDCVD